MNDATWQFSCTSQSQLLWLALALATMLPAGAHTALAAEDSHAPQPPVASPGGARMKTIGVIGGIGPQATMDFEQRVHRVAQRRIPPRLNGGYPPMVVYYHRRPPFVIGPDLLAVRPVRLDSDLRAALERMGRQVDFLVITSNGAHIAQAQMEKAAGRPVLNMVDLVVDEVVRRGWKRVGVLTLGEPTVYTERLGPRGVACVTLDPETQARLNPVLFGVMEGREDDQARQVARDAVAAVRAGDVEGVILGCTELPILLQPADRDPTMINPAQLLAEAAVARAAGLAPAGATATR